MNKKELVKNLIKDIQDIYSIANRFDNQEQIHPLDIDLALSKVRNLYELLLSLDPKGIYTPENQKEELLTSHKIIEEKDEVPPTKEMPINQKPEPEQEKEIEEMQEIISEEIHEPELIIETPAKENKIAKEIVTPEKKKNESKEPKIIEESHEILADKYQSKNFINQNIAEKNIKKDVSSKMQSKPINDINSAIGINDKFIFIRELFSGDKDHYAETIQVLNNFDTFENALEFLNDNFDWDSDDPTYERLKELVRRKYS